MPVELDKLVETLDPKETVLFFGAGSSIPSGAPGTTRLIEHLSKRFGIPGDGYTLAEFAGLIERKTEDRRRLIGDVRLLFNGIRPTGGLLNIPLYDWRNIFTTNYDELIEQAYSRRNLELPIFSSNFDFGTRGTSQQTCLFKMHGTIGKDIVDGNQSRLILTEGDYDYTEDFREKLYSRLQSDISEANLVIIGHSLSDPDIKTVVNRAAALNQKSLHGGKIALLMYERDEGRALLMEARGITVCFGGIDEFFAAFAKRAPERAMAFQDTGDPLDVAPRLRAMTADVAHNVDLPSDPVAMYNGRAASVSDIARGHTFRRSVADQIVEHVTNSGRPFAVVLGASGVGKTTAARQALHSLSAHKGLFAWEHKTEETLSAKEWAAVARHLVAKGGNGVLLIDDAHSHLNELNDLIDTLVAEKVTALRLLLVSAKHQWRVRIKTPTLFKHGQEYVLSRVSGPEIDRLLTLLETDAAIRALVGDDFSGFSRSEKRRRLVDRCESDLFVCLKNIFASDGFNFIVLREFAELKPEYQDIYRYVAAMESAGVRVHRQLIMRLLGIPALEVGASLINLTDIISEETLDEKNGIYIWQTRHQIIADIIAKHKFFEEERRVDLYSKVIDHIQPSYDLEIRTIRELCTVGIPRVGSHATQNMLLRKMMSVAPHERVPRHRLVRNLISDNQFEKAETEIRIFEKDLGPDGSIAKYKIDLMIARACNTKGLMDEDRLAILVEARIAAIAAVERYKYRTNVLFAFAEVGIETYRLSGKLDVFDEAMAALKAGEERIADPEITRAIARYERRVFGRSQGRFAQTMENATVEACKPDASENI